MAIKLQLACFERLGVPGWGVLEGVAAHARARGLLVIADGKRGDISVSAVAYAQALGGGIETPFGSLQGLGADLVTVNPLMGRDAIEPFVSAARDAGGGVLVLVRTSNQGAADIEDLELEGGDTLWERVAQIVDALGSSGVGDAGLSDVGAVVGATVPEPSGPRARVDGKRDVPAPRGRCPRGAGRGSRPGVRAGAARAVSSPRRAASPTLMRWPVGSPRRGTSRGRPPARGRLVAVRSSSSAGGAGESRRRTGASVTMGVPG